MPRVYFPLTGSFALFITEVVVLWPKPEKTWRRTWEDFKWSPVSPEAAMLFRFGSRNFIVIATSVYSTLQNASIRGIDGNPVKSTSWQLLFPLAARISEDVVIGCHVWLDI